MECASKITLNKNKLDCIVDMYINELIDKDSFIKKKTGRSPIEFIKE